tara:strand:- start:340 stop:753 length:414 start_codon:yes stop_codon:yes gene_type:complete
MPTKKMTVEFIRGYTGGLETAGMNTKYLQKRKVGELNASVTKAVNTKGFPKSIRNRWLKMVLKHDASPEEVEEFSKSMRRKALISGGDAPSGPKAKVKVSAKNFTSVNKLGKPLPKDKSGFTKVKSVKKSTIIQKKN